MGQDITGTIEVREGPGELWQLAVTEFGIPQGRCYNSFTILAGVRDTGIADPIAPLRGLPDDVTPYTATLLNEADFPTMRSWVTYAELQDALTTFLGTDAADEVSWIVQLYDTMGAVFENQLLCDSEDDVRFVFGFD